MLALIQRVLAASVTVKGKKVGEINHGLLIYLGIERHDDQQRAQQLAQRVTGFRVFADANGKMNLDVTQCGGQVLVVSQFTLAADTKKGKRPSFSTAADPQRAKYLYECFVEHIQQQGLFVQTGQFGSNMAVSSINDGPINFNLTV